MGIRQAAEDLTVLFLAAWLFGMTKPACVALVITYNYMEEHVNNTP